MAQQWYVVLPTQQRIHRSAAPYGSGYVTYLPQFLKLCRHARKVQEKLVPLFPGTFLYRWIPFWFLGAVLMVPEGSVNC